MGAHENLSQLEFEGMPARVDPPATEKSRVYTDDDIPYRDDDAHRAFRWNRTGDPLNTANPLYDDQAWDKFDAAVDSDIAAGRRNPGQAEEFIPPWRVTSSQPRINPDAVEHQVRNADPMALREDPEVYPYKEDGAEHYMVTEGNHRTLAAQRRGQLLMPANVQRWH